MGIKNHSGGVPSCLWSCQVSRVFEGISRGLGGYWWFSREFLWPSSSWDNVPAETKLVFQLVLWALPQAEDSDNMLQIPCGSGNSTTRIFSQNSYKFSFWNFSRRNTSWNVSQGSRQDFLPRFFLVSHTDFWIPTDFFWTSSRRTYKITFQNFFQILPGISPRVPRGIFPGSPSAFFQGHFHGTYTRIYPEISYVSLRIYRSDVADFRLDFLTDFLRFLPMFLLGFLQEIFRDFSQSCCRSYSWEFY